MNLLKSLLLSSSSSSSSRNSSSPPASSRRSSSPSRVSSPKSSPQLSHRPKFSLCENCSSKMCEQSDSHNNAKIRQEKVWYLLLNEILSFVKSWAPDHEKVSTWENFILKSRNVLNFFSLWTFILFLFTWLVYLFVYFFERCQKADACDICSKEVSPSALHWHYEDEKNTRKLTISRGLDKSPYRVHAHTNISSWSLKKKTFHS